jgi:2-haloalkanoic acid dehalogenase type II
MAFRYLTFDCYGTLIDWKSGIEASLSLAVGPTKLRGKELLNAYVSAEKAEEASYKKYREVLGRSAQRLGEKLGRKVSASAARKFAGSVPSWPAFGDTARFLREAGSRGHARYILSNVDTAMLERTISNNGLEIDGYVTAEDVKSYKHNKRHWQSFMEKTGARKNEVLHVAQSVYHDIIPTQEMGIASVWVNRYREKMPVGARPLVVSDSLAHLLKVIDGLSA